MEDKELFNKLLGNFAEKYPSRNIHMVGTLVYVDGMCAFNTDGFTLLYNVKRLCDELEDELL